MGMGAAVGLSMGNGCVGNAEPKLNNREVGDGALQLGRGAHCTVWVEEVNSDIIYFIFSL